MVDMIFTYVNQRVIMYKKRLEQGNLAVGLSVSYHVPPRDCEPPIHNIAWSTGPYLMLASAATAADAAGRADLCNVERGAMP